MKIKSIILIFIFILGPSAFSCPKGNHALEEVLEREMNVVVKKTAKTSMMSAGQRSKIRSGAKVEQFKKTYSKSDLEFENRNFMSQVNKLPQGKKAVYFDTENSVLKQLNDEIFETKDLSDAAGNLFNRIIFDKININPVLTGKLNGKYRDFKSMRFRFLLDEGEDSADVINALNKIYGESTTEFTKQLKATGLAPLWSARTGQSGDPGKWFLAGVGDSPLEANMGARQARGLLESGGASKLVKYSDRVDTLATDIKIIEKIRSSLEGISKLRNFNIMLDVGKGNIVLSKNAIAILRKTKRGDFTTLEKYRASLKKQFQKIFGTKVDDLSLDGMTKYFEGVDSLSPPLFIRSRAGIDLGQGNKGLVSVDFTGVGVDNAYEAMTALSKTSGASGGNANYVKNALRAIDAHVDNVTTSMNQAKIAFNKSTQSVSGKNRPAVFSGDDGMYFPDKAWTMGEKQDLVNRLAAKDPTKYRVTFVETNYKDGRVIPNALRSEYIVKAEKVEKNIRKAVTGVGEGQISPERAKKMMIAIEFKPGGSASSDWDILIGGSVTKQEKAILKNAMKIAVEAD